MERGVSRSASRSDWVIGTSVINVLFTVPHSIEDFAYGVPARFGLDKLTAGVLLAMVYGAQVLGAAWAGRERRAGYWVNLALAAFWLLGAVFDHLGEVLFAYPYRAGAISKALEVGVMLTAAAWLLAAARALWGADRAEAVRHG